jgi:hypothetical protein
MRVLRVSYLREEPVKPEQADFGITVDFAKGASDPVRVFESITVLLDGFRKLDQVTIGALDPNIQAVMILVVKIRRLSPLRSVGLPGIQPLSRGTKRQILSTRGRRSKLYYSVDSEPATPS